MMKSQTVFSKLKAGAKIAIPKVNADKKSVLSYGYIAVIALSVATMIFLNAKNSAIYATDQAAAQDTKNTGQSKTTANSTKTEADKSKPKTLGSGVVVGTSQTGSKPKPVAQTTVAKTSSSVQTTQSITTKPKTTATITSPTPCQQKLTALYETYSTANKNENIRHDIKVKAINDTYYLSQSEKQALITAEDNIFLNTTSDIYNSYISAKKSAGC